MFWIIRKQLGMEVKMARLKMNDCPEYQEWGAICKLRGIPCSDCKNCYRKRLKRVSNSLKRGFAGVKA